ncbi:hypothetical protein [Leminorella grimontii]|uniref:hypothetical protein n=1 Tax=Leminorella grimontii TaxID=82981 RepID=UPI0021C43D7D|nr:hypothetical protein [Leminorella grimontii]
MISLSGTGQNDQPTPTGRLSMTNGARSTPVPETVAPQADADDGVLNKAILLAATQILLTTGSGSSKEEDASAALLYSRTIAAVEKISTERRLAAPVELNKVELQKLRIKLIRQLGSSASATLQLAKEGIQTDDGIEEVKVRPYASPTLAEFAQRRDVERSSGKIIDERRVESTTDKAEHRPEYVPFPPSQAQDEKGKAGFFNAFIFTVAALITGFLLYLTLLY